MRYVIFFRITSTIFDVLTNMSARNADKSAKLKTTVMKKTILVILLLFFSSSVFAQTNPELNLSDRTLGIGNKGVSKELNGEIVAAKTKDFTFTINPYLWLTGVGGSVGVPGLIEEGYPSSVEFNKSFSDLAGSLKFALMVAGKFKYKKVSLLYDVDYMNLKGFDATVPEGYGLASANPSFKQLTTDLALAYSIGTGSKNVALDVYGGTRIWSLDAEITLKETNGNQVMKSKKNSWVDPVIGFQADFVLSKKWYSYVKTDFGGFGVNSDWTYMLIGGFGYMFSPQWNTSAGLKYLGVSFDKERTVWKVNEVGLLLSLGYIY